MSSILESRHDIANTIAIVNNFNKLSATWCKELLYKHDLTYVKLHGEADSMPLHQIEAVKPAMQELLSNFHPDDIHNTDECGLMYDAENISSRRTRQQEEDSTRTQGQQSAHHHAAMHQCYWQ